MNISPNIPYDLYQRLSAIRKKQDFQEIGKVHLNWKNKSVHKTFNLDNQYQETKQPSPIAQLIKNHPHQQKS